MPGLKSFPVQVSQTYSQLESAPRSSCLEAASGVRQKGSLLPPSLVLTYTRGRGNRAPCAFHSLLSPQTCSSRGTSLRLKCISGSKTKRVMGVPGSPPVALLLSEVNTTHQRWTCTPERGHSPFCHSCTLSSSELLSDFHSTPMSCQAQIQ